MSRMRFLSICLFCCLLPTLAAAQEPRAILWVIDVDEGATVEHAAVSSDLRDILSTATDADHIVDVAGLAEYVARHGLPIPGCLTGLSPCDNPGTALATALRIDIIATVTAYASGTQLTLGIQGVGGGSSRTFSVEGESLRETLFALVTDFVGAAGAIAVTSRPSGATVAINGVPVGETPYQAELSVGIYRLEITLDGYGTFEEHLEIRPNETRLIDRDLDRSFAELYVESYTQDTVVRIGDDAPVPANQDIRLGPGDYSLSIEAPDHTPETRYVTLAPGEDRHLRVDLNESPAAIQARQMGYIYERPFFVRGGLRIAGTRSGFAGATGQIAGSDLTVLCPRSSEGDCEPAGLPTNWVGLSAELGYSFEVFELILASLSYSVAPIGGAAGAGRSLTLRSSLAGGEDTEGRLDTVTRFQVDPLHVGARLLFTQNISAFLHGGVGWHTDLFDVTDELAERGSFSRPGWSWSTDLGVRYHLNDTVFISGAFFLEGDITHDDVDLTKGFDISLGMTWEDVLGISDWFSGDEPEEER